MARRGRQDDVLGYGRGKSSGTKLGRGLSVVILVPHHLRPTHLEHGTKGFDVAPRTTAGKHLEADAAKTPDVGFGRVSLSLGEVLDNWRRDGSVRCSDDNRQYSPSGAIQKIVPCIDMLALSL